MKNIIEFKNNELDNFQSKVRKESDSLIAKIIKQECPLEVGDKIKAFCFNYKTKMVQVSKISLMAFDSWRRSGHKYSFRYEGLPIRIDGEVAENRNPVWFEWFEKNGVVYGVPDYLLRYEYGEIGVERVTR